MSEPTTGVLTSTYGAVVVVVAVSYAVAAGWDGNVGLAAVVLTQLVTLWLVFSVNPGSRLKRVVLAVACAAVVVALGVVVGGVGVSGGRVSTRCSPESCRGCW